MFPLLTDSSVPNVDVADGSAYTSMTYVWGSLLDYLVLRLVITFLGTTKRCQNTSPNFSARNWLGLTCLIVVPTTLGAPTRSTTGSGSSEDISNIVILRSSVVSAVNVTERKRVCWLDADCVLLYPTCKNPPSTCRCMLPGICVILRKYGQKCIGNDSCEDSMHCVLERKQNLDRREPRIMGICRCESRARYNPFLNKCFKPSGVVSSAAEDISHVSNLPSSLDDSAVVQQIPATYDGRRDISRFPDLPDPGGEDVNALDEIPATYDGAILVGFITLSLVIVCLGLAMWCRYTSPRFKAQQLLRPLPQSHEFLTSSSESLRCTSALPTSLPLGDKDAENIPLDMFIPPPKMYQTPGFYNYLTISDNIASTSRTEQSLSMLADELSRTLR